jgi:hypothetical protein
MNEQPTHPCSGQPATPGSMNGRRCSSCSAGAASCSSIAREEILPLAQEAAGRFPLIAAREGADYYTWRAGWFRQIEAEITSELQSSGS